LALILARDSETEEADFPAGAGMLYGACLHWADLRGATLRTMNLRRANLRDADLRGADLRDADLRDADLRGADLRRARLSGADLRGARFDAATRWPEFCSPLKRGCVWAREAQELCPSLPPAGRGDEPTV